MKKLLLTILVLASIYTSKAQIQTWNLTDSIGTKKSLILSTSPVITKQDSVISFVTPNSLNALNFLKLTGITATTPLVWNNATGVMSLPNNTISGVALGANLLNLNNAYGITGASYNGSVVGNWSVDTASTTGILSKTRAAATYSLIGSGLTIAARVDLTATAGQTVFTIAGLPASPACYHLIRNGVVLPISYTTVSAGSITLTGITVAANDAITVDWIK